MEWIERTTAYTKTQTDVAALLQTLRQQVAQHAVRARQKQNRYDWAFVCNLDHLRDLLIKATAFMTQKPAEAVAARLPSGKEPPDA